jgi:hypothetical protein
MIKLCLAMKNMMKNYNIKQKHCFKALNRILKQYNALKTLKTKNNIPHSNKALQNIVEQYKASNKINHAKAL